MAIAKATVESRADTSCASWAEEGGIWDVENSLNCEASGLQLWLVFFCLMTAYCVQCQFFGTLSNFLVSAAAEIIIAFRLQILNWFLTLEMITKRICDGIFLFLFVLCQFGTYEFSLPLGKHETIPETRNPAFGGRGPGLLSRAKNNVQSTYLFDSTRGYPGEGWSNKFPLLTMVTWNCRSLTVERMSYCRALGFDVLALTEL